MTNILRGETVRHWMEITMKTLIFKNSVSIVSMPAGQEEGLVPNIRAPVQTEVHLAIEREG